MPRSVWPLRHGRPSAQIVLTLEPSGQPLPRTLLADSGAGSLLAGFELILEEDDCLLCGGIAVSTVKLGGAYTGIFPVYGLAVQVPALGYSKKIPVVGVPSVPVGFDGIACFSFLNRFHYGNFADPSLFGLES